MGQLFDKLIIIFAITGMQPLFLLMLYYLGKRKMDKELEDQADYKSLTSSLTGVAGR